MDKTIGALLLLLFFAVGCKEQKKETGKEDTMKGIYEAIFIDINNTQIDTTINANAEQVYKKLADINLTTREQFWGAKSNFMLRGLGALKIDESGEYFFRLTSSGKVKLQFNNVDLIVHKDFHEKASKSGQRVLKEGITIFDFEYFPGNQDPYLVLEWSRDGENYEVIPKKYYDSSDLGVTEVFIDGDDEDQPLNTLTEEEIASGWKLLFDGKTLNGWHTYNSPETIGKKWKAEDGTLKFDGYERYFTYYLSGRRFDHGNVDKKLEGGFDIVTDDAYENFELQLEWKISQYGNSGIFYTIQEIAEYDEGWKSSPEMQVLDDQGQKDGLINSHRSGDLYDLIASSERRTKAYGEWNKVRIIKINGAVEHWLNGAMVLKYDTNSSSWNQMIENSKFAAYKDNFAKKIAGKIGLQDHDDEVWFRNIKIKEL